MNGHLHRNHRLLTGLKGGGVERGLRDRHALRRRGGQRRK
jgi:hypothetical protein